MKKIKQETEIRNLKKEIEHLRKLCGMAGIPPLIIYLPELALRQATNKKGQSVIISGKPITDIFRWLLGYTDFRPRKDGEGLYYWRSQLRQKLSKIGIEIN